VLVDFENVQPENVDLLRGLSFKIKVFAGAKQAKIPIKTASAVQSLGPDAEYVQVDGVGKNALDFYIAYYIGRLAVETPNASFYVISKDTGFDPLLKHLSVQGISCQRLESIADIPGVKKAGSKPISSLADAAKPFDSRTISEKVDAIIANLAKRKTARPRRLKTLRSTIKAYLNGSPADAELDELIDKLKKRGVVKDADGKVTYELPS
jgi:hypothetical protein